MVPIPLEERLHRFLDTEIWQKYTMKIIHNFILHLNDFKEFNILILIIFLIIHTKFLLHKWSHKLQMLKNLLSFLRMANSKG